MPVRLYQNGQVPQVNTEARPLTGQAVSMPTNAIANAVGHVGDVATHAVKMYQQSKDARHLLDAEKAMQNTFMDFAKWQQEHPEEDQWLPEWQKRADATRSSFGKFNLSDDARLSLDRMQGQWSGQRSMLIQNQAFKQSGARLLQSAKNTVTQAIQDGDEGRALAAVKIAQQGNALFAEDAKAWELDLTQKFKEKREGEARAAMKASAQVGDFESARAEVDLLPEAERKNALVILGYQQDVDDLEELAQRDPRQASSLATAKRTAGKITGKDELAIQGVSEKTIQKFRAEQLSGVVQSINNKEPAEILAKKIDMADYLDEADRKKVMAYAQFGPTNDPIRYAQVYAKAQAFEGEEGSPEYANLVNEIEMSADGPHKTAIMGKLNETLQAPKSTQTRAFNEVFSMAADDLKNGRFGDYLGKLEDPLTTPPASARDQIRTLRNQLIAAEGENGQSEIAKDPKRIEFWEREARKKWHDNLSDDNKGDFMDFAIEDEGKKREASKRYQDTIATLEKWKADNPKATPADLRSEYEKVLVRQGAASGAAYLSPLLPAAGSTRVDLNDLLKSHAANPRK